MDLGFYTSYKMLVGVFGWEGKAHIKNRVECPTQSMPLSFHTPYYI